MVKDRRYKLAKNQINDGHVKVFREIFDIIPKTVVHKDLKIHNQRFNDLLGDVSDFKLKEFYQIADLIEVDKKLILDLAHKQFLEDSLGKRNK